MNYKYQKRKIHQAIPSALYDVLLDLKESAYLAGGAITSVFTNSEINDLDLYPKNALAHLELLAFVRDKCNVLSVTPTVFWAVTVKDKLRI